MCDKYLLAPVIGALSLCLAGPAQAQNQTRVYYSDLNLASDDGRKQLDRRIYRAVRLVCEANGAARVENLKAAMSKRGCIKETSTRAMTARDEVLIAAAKGDSTRLAALDVR